MSTTVSLTGTPQQLQQLLSRWAEIVAGSSPLAPATERPAEGEFDARAVASFVKALTPDGRRLAVLVATASADERDLPEPELWQLLGADEMTVNGYKGGIGIHWRKHFDVPNPFARQGQSPGPYFYRIDKQLADEILRHL
jgi:hypothetical protein